MKTTIEMPEPLYKKAKIRAIERGETLKQVVLTALERELNGSAQATTSRSSPWANRHLLPEFERLQAAGAYRPKSGDRDISDLIAEDRNDRPL
jgi:hypothetical protein